MRTFLALELPDPVKEHLSTVIDLLKQRIAGVRWIKPDALHLTLKFFGEISESKIKEILSVLKGVNEIHRVKPVHLKSIDAFPSMMRPKVLIVTIQEEVDNISSIFHDIENRLVSIGIEKEGRKFIPHITLGRMKDSTPILKQRLVPLNETKFYMENLVLYRSTLTRKGAIHDPLSEIRFRKDGK